MAIDTYAGLQTAIGNWLNRADLTARIPEFIELAEARILRKVRHWRMEKRATANTAASQRTLPVPDDYLEMRNLKLNTSTVDVLEFKPPAVLYEGSYKTGQPRYYSVQGEEVALEPVPDSAYEIEMNYYAFDTLSDTNTTNWLLTYYPDVYLYASLLQAEAYIRKDKRLNVWKAALDESLNEIKKDDRAARWNGSPLVVRAQK